MVLAQHKSPSWQNVQQGVLEILDALILKDAVVSVDAINTKKKMAEKIIEKKGHYVMALKQNHRRFREETEVYFHKIQRESPELIEYYEETECERSRIDSRHYQELAVSDWLTEAKEWAGIQSVLCVTRTREDKTSGKVKKKSILYQ